MRVNEDRFYDHIVIGAGISGSSAALQLAKRGKKVLLLEKLKLKNSAYQGENEEEEEFLKEILKSFDEATWPTTTEESFHKQGCYLNMGSSVVGYYNPSGGGLTAYNTLRAVQVEK